MNRDPYSNEQLRYERRMQSYGPISGPFNAPPHAHLGDRAVLWVCLAIGAVILAEVLAYWVL